MAIVGALFVLGLAHPPIALPGLAPSSPVKAGKVHCKTTTAEAFREFSAKTWRKIAWERGSPPKKVIRAQRGKLKCAAGPRHRKAMRERWRKDKGAYNAHRRAKYAERRARERARREIEALTPYDCGAAGRFAIPCAIVACESGYSWSAYNPSGAAGAYQIMGMHGRPWPVRSEADKLAHHRIAANLWRGGAGRSHWVCKG